MGHVSKFVHFLMEFVKIDSKEQNFIFHYWQLDFIFSNHPNTDQLNGLVRIIKCRHAYNRYILLQDHVIQYIMLSVWYLERGLERTFNCSIENRLLIILLDTVYFVLFSMAFFLFWYFGAVLIFGDSLDLTNEISYQYASVNF